MVAALRCVLKERTFLLCIVYKMLNFSRNERPLRFIADSFESCWNGKVFETYCLIVTRSVIKELLFTEIIRFFISAMFQHFKLAIKSRYTYKHCATM